MKIKRWIFCLLAVCLIILSAGALAEEGKFGMVYKSESVNLRQQATQYSTWLGSYGSGEWVEITGESGNWYFVTGPDGKTGYMSKNFITMPSERWGNIGIVTNPRSTSFLNLRQSPSFSAKVLDIYYNGVPCVILSRSGGWYYVKVNGVAGYFREEYIQQRYQPYAEAVATVVTPGNTGLNLRSGPGKQHSVLAQYKGGSYVMVIQRGASWWKVAVDGRIGYMDASFLKAGILNPGETEENASASTGSQGVNAYAVVNNPRATQVLNFRETASTTSRVLGQYRNGAQLAVLNQGTQWCRVVNSEGVKGYMMTEYLKLYNLPAVPTLTVNHPQRTFVYLRAMPSQVFGSVLDRVPHGAKVTVLVPGDTWVKVKYNGQTGYMMAAFLQ